MRIVVWALWLILFIALFAFAVHNAHVVELQFFGDWRWQAPLIALLLLFFLGGVLFGMLAMLPSWVRQRLEIRKLKKIRPQASEPALLPAGKDGGAAIDTIQKVARGARATS